ncbi:MAG: hypothetical protein HXS50_03445 [Theionarchaea archaeon]|nr:hypothetical protein [Theionarchaea archaeon]
MSMIYGDVELHNIEDIFPYEDGDGMQLSRLPNPLRLGLNELGKICSLGMAGSEIRFNLEGEQANINLFCHNFLETWNPDAVTEVYQGPFKSSSHVINSEPTVITITRPQNLDVLVKIARERGLPFDPALVRVVLPIWPPTILLGIDGQTSPPRKGQAPQKRLLAYGSSITHGAYAVRPTGTYPARLSQMLGLDHFNLGLGGGCHCEGQLADHIAKRSDWNLATLELGINMIGHDLDEFRRRVRYFIGRVAGENPDRWIFCIDIFTFGEDLESRRGKHTKFRRAVREEVIRLDLPRLVHLDGRRLVRNPNSLSCDLCHPSPQGMEEIAGNLARIIDKRLATR